MNSKYNPFLADPSRRLGLCCNQDTSHERQAVIAKYTELAQSIFQCTTSTVSILLGDEEYIYGSSVSWYSAKTH